MIKTYTFPSNVGTSRHKYAVVDHGTGHWRVGKTKDLEVTVYDLVLDKPCVTRTFEIMRQWILTQPEGD